jgi:hypothetical protein
MTRQLPLTPAALGALAGVFVVAVGGYFGLVWPAGRDVRQLQTQLSALSAQAAGAAQAPAPVTDVERASWQTVEERVRERFVVPDDQRELMVDLAQLARASGMLVIDMQLEGLTPGATAEATPAPSFAIPAPPTLASNPGVIRLTVRHQYRALIDFLDQLATGNTYVAVQALDVRRVENLLQSDIRLVSFRWVAAP